MFYKITVCLWCVAALVASAPASSEEKQPTVIPIVAQTDELEPNGTYIFSYETGNGIKREETSYDKTLPMAQGRSAGSGEGDDSGSDEIHVQMGSWSYTAPDGTEIKVSYIADENGFQPVGKHLPRGPQVTGQTDNDEKSGRSLKTKDQSVSASAPAAKSAEPKKQSEVSTEKNSQSENSAKGTDSTPSSESSTTEAATISTKAGEESTTTEVAEKSTDSSSDASPTSTTELPTSTTESPTSETESTTKVTDITTVADEGSSSTATASTTESEPSTTTASS